MRELLGAIFAVVLVAMGLLSVLPQYFDAQEQPAQDDAGTQLADMATAFSTYKQHNFAALVAATAAAPAAVTPAMMIATGDLYTGFQDWNIFGQHHVVVVYQPSAGVLEAYIFTYGGTPIDDVTLTRVAEAGPAESAMVLSTDFANFEGAAGGGAVRPTALFSVAGYPITAGHLAVHVVPDSYQVEQPYLSRYSTTNPDDTRLHTDVDGGNNNLNNLKTVTANTQVNTPTVADPTTPTYQLTPAGSSNLHVVTSDGSITAPAFYYHP